MLKTLSTSLALCAALLLAAPVHAASHAGAPMAKGASACEKSADDKKLAGAARNSHIKKCEADAGGGAAKGNPACEKSADDKKLAGAARNSHIKKCNADGGPDKAAAAAPKASGAKK
jgi:hypothetical protein